MWSTIVVFSQRGGGADKTNEEVLNVVTSRSIIKRSFSRSMSRNVPFEPPLSKRDVQGKKNFIKYVLEMNPLDTSIWIFNFPSLFVHLHIHMNDNIECKLKINIGDLLRHKCRLQKSKIKIKLIAQWFYPLHIYIVILIFSKSHSSFVSLQCITIFVLFIRINFLTTWLNFLFKIFLCYILHWGGGKKKKRNSSQLYIKKKKQSVKRHHRARFSSVFSRIPIIISHHPLSTKRYFLVTVHEPCDLSPSQARFSSDVDPSRSFDLPRLDRIDDHIAKNKTARLGVQLSKPGSNTLTFTFSRGCNEEKGREKKNVDGVGIRTRSNDPGENVRSPLRRCHTAVDVVVVVVIDCTQVTGGSNVSRAYMESVSPGTRLRIA